MGFPLSRSLLLTAFCNTLIILGVNGQNFLPPSARSSKPVASEPAAVTNGQSIVVQSSAPIAPVPVNVDGAVVLSNTTQINSTVVPAALPVTALKVASTVLIIARNAASAYSAYSGLNGYGIPYQILSVPQAGASLPTLNSSSTSGNFGAIVVLSEVSYDYGPSGGGFQSALTAAQWTTLYNYQTAFGVRMVRLDVFPSAASGTTTTGGCCGANQEQLISISNSEGFPTAGLKIGATMSTLGLWHYPATITNSSIAKEFAGFAPTSGFPNPTTAGVINNIGGRLQMVFFIGFATDWSATSNFLQHSWIHWVTRGLYAGYRRINLNTQVDDMFLVSDIYSPAGTTFRIRTGDLAAHISWMRTINAKMNPGSNYFMEIAHNGNGNIEEASDRDTTGSLCQPGPIEYAEQIDTPLEFQKPLGTGTQLWPVTPVNYPSYSAACLNLDPLKVWWSNPSNLNAFSHISHTFTHEDENNATYYDCYNEISWNQGWLAATGISAATKFSSKGLIPPAITGLHNGDALRAWKTLGITSAVGDNTRPALLNPQNEHWPLTTTVGLNGFDGMQITPRWATNIYYNCDLPDCTVLEWINTSAGSGDIFALLALEKSTTSRRLLSLHREPFMFHQANLRQTDVKKIVIGGQSVMLSLFQMWVETVVQEMVRLVSWPITTLKHDDISAAFAARMTRDRCSPNIAYQINPSGNTITSITVTAGNSNACGTTIPVTVPGSVTNTQGFTTEKIGSDPLTIWVKMTGAPVTFTLVPPVAL